MPEITIGSHVAIQKPLSVEGIKLDMTADGKKEIHVTKLGKPVKKVYLQKSETAWVDEETGQPVDGKVYKSMNGKPVDSFKRTKVIDTYDKCDTAELLSNAIVVEKTYQLICPSLKTELKELGSGKGITFRYAHSGFKVHRAVVYFDSTKDAILMRLTRGSLSKIDLSEDVVTEVKTEDEGVESISLDALEV